MLNTNEVRQEILSFLNEQKIPYEYQEHEKAHTIEDCLAMPFITADVTICRNLFLCNRQQSQFYLLLLRPLTAFRTSIVSKALGSSRLSFAPEDALPQLLHLTSGSVSPLGLFYDKEHRITLAAEKAILDTARIAFHPCDNHATVIFSQADFWQRVLPALGVNPVMIDVEIPPQITV